MLRPHLQGASGVSQASLRVGRLIQASCGPSRGERRRRSEVRGDPWRKLLERLSRTQVRSQRSDHAMLCTRIGRSAGRGSSAGSDLVRWVLPCLRRDSAGSNDVNRITAALTQWKGLGEAQLYQSGQEYFDPLHRGDVRFYGNLSSCAYRISITSFFTPHNGRAHTG